MPLFSILSSVYYMVACIVTAVFLSEQQYTLLLTGDKIVVTARRLVSGGAVL